jgi:transposase
VPLSIPAGPREVVNGIMYVLSTGCQWRYVPKDLPPKSTLFDYFDLWNYDGTLENIHHALYVKCREAVEREASPTACIIDSQSSRARKKGALHRPERLRRGQEDQRQEASHPRRYRRPLASGRGSSRRHSGSRRWGCGSLDSVRSVSVLEQTFRRWRLSRAAILQGSEESPTAPCDGDREKIRLCDRLRGLAETLGCRTNLRVARPVSTAGERLRKSIPQCFGVPPPRFNPPHATKALF